MLYLVGSIVLTSYLILSFKIVERFRINTFQTIVFNYITCVIIGSLVNGAFPFKSSTLDESWLIWAMVMGATFIFLFNIIGYTAQKVGVSVASVANKLSLVIPFLFSIYFYNEPISAFRIFGICVALLAVYLVCYKRKEIHETVSPGHPVNGNNYWLPFLPLILFIGSGLLDSMIKYVEQGYLNPYNQNSFLITAFASAAVIGMAILSFAVLIGKQKLSYKAVIAGIAIGIPNYFSIWCLVKVLKLSAGRSSAIIPVNNMGIVLCSALVAWIAFHERLTLINRIGILFSILSIALIAFG
jgi:drug/metabolite transporter (DMT)-like permease